MYICMPFWSKCYQITAITCHFLFLLCSHTQHTITTFIITIITTHLSFYYMMRTRLYCFLGLFLHIVLCLVGVASRHFPTKDDFTINNNHQQGKIQNAQALQINRTSNYELKGKNKRVESEEKEEEMKKIGSRPPSCEHKCYECNPCEATQVPTTSAIVGVQYTNYEPEGWKCKCGPTFYTP